MPDCARTLRGTAVSPHNKDNTDRQPWAHQKQPIIMIKAPHHWNGLRRLRRRLLQVHTRQPTCNGRYPRHIDRHHCTCLPFLAVMSATHTPHNMSQAPPTEEAKNQDIST